jgi:flagellar motor switch protein FliM
MVVRQIRVSDIPKWNTCINLFNPISAIKKIQEKFKNTKLVIRSDKAKNDEQFNDK